MEGESSVEVAPPNLDAKRPRDAPEKEEAVPTAEPIEQPRKKARREELAKCSKCKKRHARRGMFP